MNIKFAVRIFLYKSQYESGLCETRLIQWLKRKNEIERSNLPFKVLGDFVENSETIVWDAKSVQRDIFLSLQNCFLFRRH